MQGLPVMCRKCGAGVAMRVSRTGVLQRRVLNLLGMYPWKCGACGATFLYPKRGQKGRRERTGLEGRPIEQIESHGA